MSAPTLTRGQSWALVLAATFTMTISYIDRQALAVLAPTITRELRISETQYGLLASALHALAPGFGALVVSRVLLGFAESPSFPGASQTVHRALPPAERPRGVRGGVHREPHQVPAKRGLQAPTSAVAPPKGRPQPRSGHPSPAGARPVGFLLA